MPRLHRLLLALSLLHLLACGDKEDTSDLPEADTDTDADTDADADTDGACADAVPCYAEDYHWKGHVLVTSQAGVDEISHCSSIEGDLFIQYLPEDVSSLELPCLREFIDGGMAIRYNDYLQEVSLPVLESRVEIVDNESLAKVTAPYAGTYGLIVSNCPLMNDSAIEIDFPERIEGHIRIYENDSWTELHLFSSVKEISESFFVANNPALVSINLQSIELIEGNFDVHCNESLTEWQIPHGDVVEGDWSWYGNGETYQDYTHACE